MWGQFLKHYWSKVEVVRTKSAMNPILVLCGICEIPFIYCVLHTTGLLQIIFSFFCFLPLAASIIAYFIFLFCDPKRLQSEEYQLRHEAMMQSAKGQGILPSSQHVMDHSQTKISDTDTEEIGNQEAPRLQNTSSTKLEKDHD